MGEKKLSFDEVLADEVENSQPGRPTALEDRVLSVVDDDTREQIVAALCNKSVSNNVIHRTLRRLGFEVSAAAIRNYRIRNYPDTF